MIKRILIEIKDSVNLEVFRKNLETGGFKYEEYTAFGKGQGGVIAGYRGDMAIETLSNMPGVVGVEDEALMSILNSEDSSEK